MEITHEGERLVLRDGRLLLRECLPDDAAALAAGAAGGLVWIDGGPGEGTAVAAGMTVRAAEAGMYRPGWGLFTIQRADDGTALGGAGFHGPPVGGVAEIGYDLCVSARGAGWATDAVRLVTRWALDRPDVDTVVATTEHGNGASRRVLERAGFVRGEDRDGLRAYSCTARDRAASG